MKYLILILLFASCAKPNDYQCVCLSSVTGQNMHTYDLKAKDLTHASGQCYEIQAKHTMSGVHNIDCAIR